MTHVVPITTDFAVARTLQAQDFAALAAQGFRMIINFLPDGETTSQVASEDARRLCESAGMVYAHVPVQKYGVFAEEVIGGAHRAMALQQGPILAYCASGQRAAIVWAAVNSQAMPVDTVLSTLKNAGFDFGYIRDDLELQADKPCWHAANAKKEQQPQAHPAV